MLVMSENLGLEQENAHQYIDQVLDISCHLSLRPCQLLLQIANYLCNWWAFKSQGGCIHRLSSKKVYTGTVTNGPHKFCYLK